MREGPEKGGLGNTQPALLGRFCRVGSGQGPCWPWAGGGTVQRAKEGLPGVWGWDE